MTITQIPGTNVFYGGDNWGLADEENLIFAKKNKIKTIFFLTRNQAQLPKMLGIRTVGFEGAFHPVIESTAQKRLVQIGKRLKSNFAIICLAGADSSPTYAIACLLAKGHSPQDIKQRLMKLPLSQLPRNMDHSIELGLQINKRYQNAQNGQRENVAKTRTLKFPSVKTKFLRRGKR